MVSSKKNDHPTPWYLFNSLNEEFGFEIDLCASQVNAKCARYVTQEEDFLKACETLSPMVGFINPPYQIAENACKPNCKKKKCKPDGNRGHCTPVPIPGTAAFVEAAYKYSQRGATVVCLLPSETGTGWFQDIVQPHASEIRFLRGRVTFEGQTSPAPFWSLIAVFKP
jgi:phage N-6-adenine-methyltransferase